MKSIAIKLWLGITTIVIIILILIWSFQIGFLKEFYLSERETALRSNNQELAVEIATNAPDLEFDYVYQDTIDSYSEQLNVRIFIFDTDLSIKYMNFNGIGKNSIIHPSVGIKDLVDPKRGDQGLGNVKDNIEDRIIAGMKRQLNGLEVNDTVLSEAPFVQRIDDGHPQNQGIVSVQPIEYENSTIGYIIMHTPVAPIEETIETLKKQLSIISVISLVLATILASVYAILSIKPIRRLEEATKRIAKGDFTTRVNNVSDDEIGQLGKSINHMAEELGKIEEFRRDFIANVTHELKTPISLISAYAELVKELPALDKESNDRHMIEIIEESARLNRIVEEILYLSKLESNNIPLQYNTFEVGKLASEVVDSLHFAANDKQIQVNVSINDDIQIYGDREKMHQVFYNLISNAIHHCPNNTHISVESEKHPDFNRIAIRDNGVGIASKDLPYIWDRFFKTDKSGKRNDSGTGLGMSIVKNILESHQLKYGIQSAVNKGTTVYFDIPTNS